MPRTQRLFEKETIAIGRRLISSLKDDFGLTMKEAAKVLGYANSTTLHKIQSGGAMPDPVRLANFAQKQNIIMNRTMNLHWVMTGNGSRMVDRKTGINVSRARLSQRKSNTLDDDIIIKTSKLDDHMKEALLVLISGV